MPHSLPRQPWPHRHSCLGAPLPARPGPGLAAGMCAVGRKTPTGQLSAASRTGVPGALGATTAYDASRGRRVPTRDASHVARPPAVAVPHVALLIGRALPAATIGYTCSCFSTYASSSTGPSAPHRTAPRRAASPRAHDVGGGLHTARARWLHRGGARTVRGGRGGWGGGRYRSDISVCVWLWAWLCVRECRCRRVLGCRCARVLNAIDSAQPCLCYRCS